MAHANWTAAKAKETEALRAMDECAAGAAPGMSAFWSKQWKAAHEKVLTTCPTCGGLMPRALGAKGYHCHDCTARDESAY